MKPVPELEARVAEGNVPASLAAGMVELMELSLAVAPALQINVEDDPHLIAILEGKF
ncbi:MAG: hypothetical protein MUF64_06940 [Polyangiaceae bacterium]|jgi:hypothetical protein|nr:hypothetical protein [Polyangiaceae bacterium]